MDILLDKNVRIKEALDIAARFGTIEGDHHKMWVIDQMCRSLMTDTQYENWVRRWSNNGEQPWSEGIAP